MVFLECFVFVVRNRSVCFLNVEGINPLGIDENEMRQND